MSICMDCGNHHDKETECPYIYQVCVNCGERTKTAPDVAMMVPYLDTMTCAICGTQGRWRFES